MVGAFHGAWSRIPSKRSSREAPVCSVTNWTVSWNWREKSLDLSCLEGEEGVILGPVFQEKRMLLSLEQFGRWMKRVFVILGAVGSKLGGRRQRSLQPPPPSFSLFINITQNLAPFTRQTGNKCWYMWPILRYLTVSQYRTDSENIKVKIVFICFEA